MEESNNKFSNTNLSMHSNINIMNMLYGYEPNNIYVGDYFIYNKIYYRFAGFNKDRSAILLPDKILCRSSNSFSKVIKPGSDQKIERYILPKYFSEFPFPILNYRLIELNDLHNKLIPLFNYEPKFIVDHFNNPYFLRDVKNKYAYMCINEHGKISTAPADMAIGVRPLITIGYNAYSIR